jgi:hypothetical protein
MMITIILALGFFLHPVDTLKCFSFPFPHIMGGLTGHTRLYTMETDALMNIVTAGDTYD